LTSCACTTYTCTCESWIVIRYRAVAGPFWERVAPRKKAKSPSHVPSSDPETALAGGDGGTGVCATCERDADLVQETNHRTAKTRKSRRAIRGDIRTRAFPRSSLLGTPECKCIVGACQDCRASARNGGFPKLAGHYTQNLKRRVCSLPSVPSNSLCPRSAGRCFKLRMRDAIESFPHRRYRIPGISRGPRAGRSGRGSAAVGACDE
jgi:hypothetical protein